MLAHFASVFLFFAVSALFPSCSKTTIHNPKPAQTLTQDDVSQAKALDTPIPLGYTYVTQNITDNTCHRVYHGKLSIAQTKTFYLQEMERLGWLIIDLSSSQEALLFCSKSGKHCALSIRSHETKNVRTTVIHLFVKEQKTNWEVV